MEISILRTLRVTLAAMTLAITLSAGVTTCSAQEQNQNGVAVDKTVSASHRDGAVLKLSERDFVESESLSRDPVLIAQAPALRCYTNFGWFWMVVALPPGSVCQVNVPFYPYVIYGVAGY